MWMDTNPFSRKENVSVGGMWVLIDHPERGQPPHWPLIASRGTAADRGQPGNPRRGKVKDIPIICRHVL